MPDQVLDPAKLGQMKRIRGKAIHLAKAFKQNFKSSPIRKTSKKPEDRSFNSACLHQRRSSALIQFIETSSPISGRCHFLGNDQDDSQAPPQINDSNLQVLLFENTDFLF
ncbi:hypothetical protein PO124_18240 [Bacillus licheniformis]|nr:hypothetical protein [Bacillus licheniformis]